MKKIKYLVILFFILFSCQKFELLEHSNPLEDGRPFVSTIKSDFITSTTAELYGEVISTGELKITSFGHCWSTSNTPTVENMYQDNDNYTSNKYVTNITGLNPLTKYYFRAYAINSIGTAYGDELSFTTNEAGEPIITTTNASDITSISVNLEGEITDTGMALITQHGHCWSTGQNPTIGDSKTSLGAIGLGSFISNVSSLTQNTIYYFRAYATNSFGTVYGSSLSFSTTNGEPTVVTIGSSNLTASSVLLEGDITGIGDSPVTQHGHCWSTGQNPTIGDPYTTNGNASTGIYISNTNLLSQATTYYFRAYATNSFGTVYGAVMSFTTESFPIADFSTASTDLLVGESIYMLDLSQNNPTSWSWIATGANPSASSLQNPTFQYNSIGSFDIELTVFNSNGNDSEVKTDYISVKDCESFANGLSNWNNNGWQSSTNPASCIDDDCIYSWAGNSSSNIIFSISKSYQNVPSNINVSFWYKIYSPSGDLSLKLNGVTIWSSPGQYTGWTNEIVVLPQGGNINLTFESILTGTQSVYIDNICLQP